MKITPSLLVGGGLISLILICCTILVALDQLDGDNFLAVVVGPLVGAIVGYVARGKTGEPIVEEEV